jgi:epoxyqueuosine reductase
MVEDKDEELKNQIIQKAKELGACAAGIADVEVLKKSPSHLIYDKIGNYKTVGNKEGQIKPGKVAWPAAAESAIIVAVEHAEAKPEMDWWIEGYIGGTAGNRTLMDINDRFAIWLEKEQGIKTTKLPYHIEHGGILLKDTAVIAGLGCLGKNNLLVTPEFGPRVRLRAMLTEAALPSTDAIDFDPCKDCDMPCKQACPQAAFNTRIYSEKDFGIDQLPARDGVFSRPLCNRQMILDESGNERINIADQDIPRRMVKYCRLCEFSCPVGRLS